jgi:hypothetical protein
VTSLDYEARFVTHPLRSVSLPDGRQHIVYR